MKKVLTIIPQVVLLPRTWSLLAGVTVFFTWYLIRPELKREGTLLPVTVSEIAALESFVRDSHSEIIGNFLR